eukprot:6203599-Pleurochrysis_carterae.AAC.1
MPYIDGIVHYWKSRCKRRILTCANLVSHYAAASECTKTAVSLRRTAGSQRAVPAADGRYARTSRIARLTS